MILPARARRVLTRPHAAPSRPRLPGPHSSRTETNSLRRDDGTITGRISRCGEGTYHVTITLRADGKTMSETFVWNVQPMNHPPRLRRIADQHSRVGEDVEVRLKAFDRDGDTLEFTAANLPPGISLNTAGCLVGVAGGPGRKYAVQITVSDGRATATQSFDWTVVPPKKKETPKKK